MIPRSSLSYVLAQLRCSTHLLECPRWASLRAPEVALAAKECLRRTRRRFRAYFRRTDICIFWRLGFRQSSFHLIARIARRAAPYAWTQPPLSLACSFPLLSFRTPVSHPIQEQSSESFPTPSGIQQGASRRNFAISRGPPGTPSHTPGPGRRFPGMLFSPVTLSRPGKPSDPEIFPPISPRCAGDTAERLVAQTGRR